ncbi:uncharacterized protein CTRU02_205298 [Colletotrichum truncatum]|uniref:Uncharacterized protein n=1 Tax=Colletotrichum truncatum TaxID=5467 RepID=A0ACC3Z3L3_COLTU|nr:uncharacterized protein CTRU02_04354 [Colletotrichum truncatum]KAF6795544.1 hypothetical protein CTRU02_04354 [Colletotrichum truncatum]
MLVLAGIEDLEVPATSLSRFGKLPAEIRCAIWRASLPPPRVYEPHLRGIDADLKPTKFFEEWAPPEMRESCREAYNICMSAGKFRFGYFENSHVRGLWYNNDVDAIYYSCQDQLGSNCLDGIKNIYTSMDMALSGDCVDVLIYDHGLHLCQRLVVAMWPKYPMRPEILSRILEMTKPTFRRIRDQDIVGINEYDNQDYPEGAEGAPITWGEVKQVLQNLLEQGRQHVSGNKSKWESKGPFALEAVEVFRK